MVQPVVLSESIALNQIALGAAASRLLAQICSNARYQAAVNKMLADPKGADAEGRHIA